MKHLHLYYIQTGQNASVWLFIMLTAQCDSFDMILRNSLSHNAKYTMNSWGNNSICYHDNVIISCPSWTHRLWMHHCKSLKLNVASGWYIVLIMTMQSYRAESLAACTKTSATVWRVRRAPTTRAELAKPSQTVRATSDNWLKTTIHADGVRTKDCSPQTFVNVGHTTGTGTAYSCSSAGTSTMRIDNNKTQWIAFIVKCYFGSSTLLMLMPVIVMTGSGRCSASMSEKRVTPHTHVTHADNRERTKHTDIYYMLCDALEQTGFCFCIIHEIAWA